MAQFTFPDDARWDAAQDSLEFSIEIGEYRGVVRVRREAFRRLLGRRPTAAMCVEGYHLDRAEFEQAAEGKVRRRELTEDGNLELDARDLKRAAGRQSVE